MKQERRTDAGQDRDADLLARTRTGDQHAYAELWRRYAQIARAVARTYWWSADSDDLVAESFTRIYQAIRAGKGPTSAFKPYLFATMRNLAISWGRSRREVPIEHIAAIEDPDSTEGAAEGQFDASLVSKAILTLPQRWQEVLWFAEVEELSMQEIGKRLGISEGAAALLAFRAREGLRQAWITAHLTDRPPASKECRWTLGKLGGHARRRLTGRDDRRVRAHLEQCGECRARAEEARQASSRILSVLLPGGIALGGGVRVWESLASAGASAVTVPMPASVLLPVGGLVTAKAGLVMALVTVVTLTVGLAATMWSDEGVVVAAEPAVERGSQHATPAPAPAHGAPSVPVAPAPAPARPATRSAPSAPVVPPPDPDPVSPGAPPAAVVPAPVTGRPAAPDAPPAPVADAPPPVAVAPPEPAERLNPAPRVAPAPVAGAPPPVERPSDELVPDQRVPEERRNPLPLPPRLPLPPPLPLPPAIPLPPGPPPPLRFAPVTPVNPVITDIPVQISRTQWISASVRCEVGADLTVEAFGVVVGTGTCTSQELWQASIDVSSFPVPSGTAITFDFTQSGLAGVTMTTTAEVIIVD